MGDSPLRSLMSLLLDSFEVPMSGSDFKDHFQNRLGQRLIDMGVDPYSKKTFSRENVSRLRNLILRNQDLIEFVISQARPQGLKFDEILGLFEAHMENAG